MNRDNLLPAIAEGRVTQATIDEKVRHILQTAIRFGWLDRPQTELSFSTYNEQNHQMALQAAREGMVLLKNDGNLLPLDKQRIKSVLVVGPDAYPGEPAGAGSARVLPFATVSVLQGISSFLGPSATVYYEAGLPSAVAAAASTEFLTEPQNGKRGLKLESLENADLSGTPASTQIVPHLNESGKTWDDLFTDMKSLVALFKSIPKPSMLPPSTGKPTPGPSRSSLVTRPPTRRSPQPCHCRKPSASATRSNVDPSPCSG